MAFTFFRKYNKWILAIGGSLLMVIFLLPAAGNRSQRQAANPTLGTVGDREIDAEAQRQADAQLQLLSMLRREIAATLPQDQDRAMVWLLAGIEADQNGIDASMAEAGQLLDQLQLPPQAMAQVLDRFQTTEAGVQRALQHWLKYQRLLRLLQMPMRISEPEIRHFAKTTRSTVNVDVVSVPASHLLDDAPPPSDDEIRSHFQQYKDVLPGIEQPFGFGYRLPARVKIEWIALPLTMIRDSIRVDDVEANRYYLDHPEQFVPGGPFDPERSDPNAHADADPNEPLPFDLVRSYLMDRLSTQQARQKQEQAIRFIRAELERPLREYPRDPNTGFLMIPADAELPSLASAAQSVAANAEFGFEPRVVGVDGWTAITDLSDREGLGQSFLLLGGDGQRGIPTPQYVASVHELSPGEDNPLRGANLQVGLPSQAVVDSQGTRYIFRLRAAEASRPPRDLATVQGEVVADLTRLKAYELVQGRADGYAAKAAEDGMAALAATLGEDFTVESLPPFPRRQMTRGQQGGIPQLVVPLLPVVGQSEPFVDGVFDLAQAIGPEGDAVAVPASDRTGSIAVDPAMAVHIVQITDYQPIHAEQYVSNRQTFMQQVLLTDILDLNRQVANPFTYEQIAERVGFQRAEGEASEDDQADANAPAAS